MSASNEWFEYHLTPRGWESGSEQTDFGNLKEKEPPNDRVMSVRVREYLAALGSKMERSEEEIYRANDADAAAALIERYGESPR